MKNLIKTIFLGLIFSLCSTGIIQANDVIDIKPSQKTIDLSKVKLSDKKLPRELPPNIILKLPFEMSVEEAADIQGTGTAVLGFIKRGQISVGDRVSIIGYRYTFETNVTAISIDRKKMKSAKAGDAAGIFLRGLNRNNVKRGMLLIAPDSLQMHKAFRAEITLNNAATSSNDFDINAKNDFIHLYIHGADVYSEYFLPTTNYWKVGEKTQATFDLSSPVGLRPGMKFVLRKGGRTIGEGVVSEILF